MNGSGRRLAFVMVMVFLGCGSAFAQPVIPVDKIPDKIDKEVADQIRKLYSAEALKRYEALEALLVMGGKAAPAVPFVVNMLGDEGEVIIQAPLWRRRHQRLSVADMAKMVLAEWCRGTYRTYQQVREAVESSPKTPSPVHGDMFCQIAELLMSALKTSRDENVKRNAGAILGRFVNRMTYSRSRIKTGPEKLSPEQALKIREAILECWLTAIRDEDVHVRWNAAGKLGVSKSPKAVDPLIAALKDRDKRVRKSAIYGLGQLRAERAIGALIESLGNPDLFNRGSVAGALRRIGTPTVKQLIATIADAKSPSRESAARILSRMDIPVRYGDVPVQYADEIQALLAALKHKEPLLRASAAMALRKMQQSVEPLIVTLKDEDPNVRAAAAWSLGHIYYLGHLRFKEQKPRVIKSLIDLAGKDESAWVRVAAVWSLNGFGLQKNPQILKALLAAMKDKAYIVRLEATTAMERRCKNEEVVQALIVALDDPCSGIRKKALLSLPLNVKLGKRAVLPLIKLLENKDKMVRRHAAKALGGIKDDRVVPLLIRLLKDKDSVICCHAAETLGCIKDNRAIEPLIETLSSATFSRPKWAARGALCTITGKSFGVDPTEWRRWFEKNRAKNKKPDSDN